MKTATSARKTCMSPLMCAIACIFFGPAGCAYNYDHQDLTTSPEVQQAGIIGKHIVLKEKMLLVRMPWEEYDDLVSPQVLPDRRSKIMGELAGGTSILVVSVQHQMQCDGVWHWPRKMALGQICSGPYSGRLTVIGDEPIPHPWPYILKAHEFSVEREALPATSDLISN